MRKILKPLDRDMLNEILEYREGELYRKPSQPFKRGRAGSVGKKAGYVSNSRKMIEINGVRYSYQRVIWCMFFGDLDERIICVNGDNNNTKIENLAIATRSLIGARRKIYKNNTSGCKGVFWNKINKKWVTITRVNGKAKYFGSFKTKEDAYKKYLEVIQNLHGDLAI